jgi:phospholipase/lecithinase/hemolysin
MSLFKRTSRSHHSVFQCHLLAENSTEQAAMACAVASYNQLLRQSVTQFQQRNRDATVMFFDTAPSFNHTLDNPTAYGAPTCYNSDGVSCLWWNDSHPGQAIHHRVASDVASLV